MSLPDSGMRTFVLEAAARVFVSKGIANSDMSEVAAAAGVSVEAVSSLFGSKDELFLTLAIEVLHHHFETLAATRNEQRAAGKSGSDVVCAVVARTRAFSREYREKYLVAVSPESMGYAVDVTHPLFPQYQQQLSHIGELANDMFSVGQEDGSIRRSLSPERLTAVLWGAVVGILRCYDMLDEPRSGVRPRADIDPALVSLQLLLDGLREKAG